MSAEQQEHRDDDDSAEKRDMAMLKSHAAQLAEHFDGVQIIGTRHSPEDGGTIQASWGEGNFYARLGSVRSWLLKEDATIRRGSRGGDDD